MLIVLSREIYPGTPHPNPHASPLIHTPPSVHSSYHTLTKYHVRNPTRAAAARHKEDEKRRLAIERKKAIELDAIKYQSTRACLCVRVCMCVYACARTCTHVLYMALPASGRVMAVGNLRPIAPSHRTTGTWTMKDRSEAKKVAVTFVIGGRGGCRDEAATPYNSPTLPLPSHARIAHG